MMEILIQTKKIYCKKLYCSPACILLYLLVFHKNPRLSKQFLGYQHVTYKKTILITGMSKKHEGNPLFTENKLIDSWAFWNRMKGLRMKMTNYSSRLNLSVLGSFILG